MGTTSTTNYNLLKPNPFEEDDTWGSILNSNLDKIDTQMKVNANAITALDAAKQPLDADLTAIAALAGTSGFLKKTAADTWSLDTATYSVVGHTHVMANITDLQAAMDAKAPLASPAFTGTPTAPTPATADSSTKIATTAYVKANIAGISGGGGGTVTSVAVSGGSTGLTTSGGPITTSGTITIAGTLAVGNGGTGSTTASGARTNLGLGSAATYSVSTSGANVPLMSGANTWSGEQTFSTGGIVLAASTDIIASNSSARILLGNPSTHTTPRVAISGITGGAGSGTTPPSAGDATGIELVSSSPSANRYPIVFNNGFAGGPYCGWIRTNSGNTLLESASDYRLKKDVADISGAIAKVQQLRPVTFRWKGDDVSQDINQGFIAHEVQQVVPEIVCGEKDAVDANGKILPQGMSYTSLVPLLTAALKDAIIKIDALEARIATLEAV